MSPQLKECEASALKLPVAERAALVEHLIASLDVLDDPETERLWVKEAEVRYTAYKEGRISARPAADAIRDARARIR
jgi:putative addiction module component (TIGR02574 family)